MLSIVAHELRTPVAAIYAAATGLSRTDALLDDAQRERLLTVITGESRRLSRLVDDLVAAARAESGRLEVRLESCDAAELATGAVEAARLHLPDGLSLGLEARPDLPRVAADPDRTRQVLSNLIDNAVKYSPAGSAIAVLVERRDGCVRFAVRDEGPGIPADERERIFEKFHRLEHGAAARASGAGLGLFVCRELVTGMGGRIWADSKVESGSTLVVELPVA